MLESLNPFILNPPDPLIFLDIDGVLNSHALWDREPDILESEKLAKQGRMEEAMLAYRLESLDIVAIAELKKIIEATDAKLVLSSTWRMTVPLEEMGVLLEQKGLSDGKKLFIGKTPRIWCKNSPFTIPERNWDEETKRHDM